MQKYHRDNESSIKHLAACMADVTIDTGVMWRLMEKEDQEEALSFIRGQVARLFFVTRHAEVQQVPGRSSEASLAAATSQQHRAEDYPTVGDFLAAPTEGFVFEMHGNTEVSRPRTIRDEFTDRPILEVFCEVQESEESNLSYEGVEVALYRDEALSNRFSAWRDELLNTVGQERMGDFVRSGDFTQMQARMVDSANPYAQPLGSAE